LAGLLLLAGLVAAAILAPWIAPYDPIEVTMDKALGPPSRQHIMGTDRFGRDVFSRIVFGARVSLSVGIIATGIATICGVLLGLFAGYLGGTVDLVIMRIIDFLLAFPGLVLALMVIAVLGPNLQNLMIAVGIRHIPSFARVVRGSVLSTKENLYVEAARAIGCSTPRVTFRHVFPNVLAPVIVLTSLDIGDAIIVGAGLSFIGMGAQPPTPEWGVMLSSGRAFIRSAWWLTVYPGLAIMISVLAVNLVGDGVREAFDPRRRPT
jgi:peptide/nickel transport system permease protein